MEKFKASISQFNTHDLNNFGGCLKQIYDKATDTYLEFRIKKSNNKMTIIQYYTDADGYSFYESTIN